MALELIVRIPNRKDRRLALADTDLIAGRSTASDVFIDHPSVGDPHARLRRYGDRLTLTDLEPSTHTLVNGERIGHFAERRIDHGDVLYFGDVRVEVSWDEASARLHVYPQLETSPYELDPVLVECAHALVADMESGLGAIQPATDSEIALRLNVSVATVERRIRALKGALGIDRSEPRSRQLLARRVLETRCHLR